MSTTIRVAISEDAPRMILPMLLRDRRRCRIALTVILCLLFQQVAMAAYACSAERMPVQVVAMAMPKDCAGMSTAHTQDNPVLCEKHCAPDRSLLTDHAAPEVPAVALPPIGFHSPLLQAGVLLAADVPVHASDPPPRLRFCSLLI